jgi:hypothetical protein
MGSQPKPAKPKQAKAKPKQAKAKPTQAKAKPTQARAEPKQARAEAKQARAEPKQARAEPKQAEPKQASWWRHWRRALLVLAPIVAAVAVVLVLTSGKDATPGPQASSEGSPSFDLAQVRSGQRVALRNAPDGREVARLGAKTEFGSPRTFYVAERRGDWLGVPSADRPDGTLGWIRDDPAQLDFGSTKYSLRVDLSAQRIELRDDKKVIRRIPITIGATGTETPTGTFAVTDGLAGSQIGPWYGCCILALTGHQSNLPSDWVGGDRIAIHGTPGPVGGAVSHGCIRASNRDMVTLFALIPLGAPVFIHA